MIIMSLSFFQFKLEWDNLKRNFKECHITLILEKALDEESTRRILCHILPGSPVIESVREDSLKVILSKELGETYERIQEIASLKLPMVFKITYSDPKEFWLFKIAENNLKSAFGEGATVVYTTLTFEKRPSPSLIPLIIFSTGLYLFILTLGDPKGI